MNVVLPFACSQGFIRCQTGSGVWLESGLVSQVSHSNLHARVASWWAGLRSTDTTTLSSGASMCVQTITTDNGREFFQHEYVAAKLNTDYIFAHPYSSWERGANENMNGLIRQFFPKKMAFESITKNDIELATHHLNHRPRKCLGFRTPYEVFMEQLKLHNHDVALQT
ncbi:IS30 family transposase [Rhodoferax sp.]|uniref:IS30 family transposase n=1 Tax=Rhodoferax sp. TaxID=50421 RepID=UPI00261952EF|nr:IS30 family transposase [Rhodoferax sp.]MDD2811658.1 IS30 family transposase [Rhodoferax sp.]